MLCQYHRWTALFRCAGTRVCTPTRRTAGCANVVAALAQTALTDDSFCLTVLQQRACVKRKRRQLLAAFFFASQCGLAARQRRYVICCSYGFDDLLQHAAQAYRTGYQSRYRSCLRLSWRCRPCCRYFCGFDALLQHAAQACRPGFLKCRFCLGCWMP